MVKFTSFKNEKWDLTLPDYRSFFRIGQDILFHYGRELATIFIGGYKHFYLITTTCFALITPALIKSSGCWQSPYTKKKIKKKD